MRGLYLLAAACFALVGSSLEAADSGFFALSACSKPNAGNIIHGIAAAPHSDAAMIEAMTQCRSAERDDVSGDAVCCKVVLPNRGEEISADSGDRRCFFAYALLSGINGSESIIAFTGALGSSTKIAQNAAKSRCDELLSTRIQGTSPINSDEGEPQTLGRCAAVGRTCLSGK